MENLISEMERLAMIGKNNLAPGPLSYPFYTLEPSCNLHYDINLIPAYKLLNLLLLILEGILGGIITTSRP